MNIKRQSLVILSFLTLGSITMWKGGWQSSLNWKMKTIGDDGQFSRSLPQLSRKNHALSYWLTMVYWKAMLLNTA